MKDPSRTNQELIEEISVLRQRIQELEQPELGQNQVERGLNTSRDFIVEILDNLIVSLIIIDPANYNILEANKTFTNSYGLDKNAVIGKRCYEVTHNRATPCSLPNDICPLVETLKTGKPTTVEHIHYDSIGSKLHVEVSTIPLINGKDEIYQIIHLSRDITDRKRAEEALKESEEKYRSLAASVDSMYLVDRDYTYLFINEGYRMRFGLPLEEIIGRRYDEFHSEEDTKKFADCIREVCEAGKPIIKEHRSEKDGRYFLRTFTPIMGRSPVGEISKVVIVSKDITERKQAEKDLTKTVQQLQETRDMLIQFEKHAAVGRLAAGVAHEILNPVSIISSRLQFIQDETLTEQARESVRICREQLQRITKIGQDLHQPAAKQPGILVGGDLRRVIEVGLQLTERRIKEDHVSVEYDPPLEVIPVKMERDRLVRVMVNLILNACDAMTNNQAKRLIITVHRPEDSSKDHSIFLTVADNGQGISAGNLNRIFEPFFTTKDPGKGKGLGLSVSKGIVQNHGGTIHAKNNDMGGASFIVELPLHHP